MEPLIRNLQVLLGTPLDYVPRLLIAVVVMVVTLILARWAKRASQVALQRVRGLPRSATGLIQSIVYVAVVVLGILVMLQALGLSQAVYTTIASLGVVGLVVGFALQDITKQFASGILLLLSHPFEVGDRIKVGAHEGNVVELRLRCTVLKTAAGDEVLIPNAEVYTSTLYNLSRYPQRRIAVPLSLPLSEDLEAQRARIIAAVADIPGVVATPPPSVVCTTAVDGKVSAEVHCWIDRATANQDEVMTRMIVAANRALVA